MKHKILVSLLTSDQEFQLLQAASARDAAARAGIEVEVQFAENNAVQQIHQIFERIHADGATRPAAIVVETVSGEGLERAARNAVRAGIGWVLMNRGATYIEALRAERSDLPISSVSVDSEEVGRIQGRQLRALLPSGGRVLYIQGPPDTAAAQERLRGAEEIIRTAGIETKILNGDWTEDGGEKATAGWLRLKTSAAFRPDVVCCQNDAMAVGARRAIRQHKPEWEGLAFTGCDGLPEGGRKQVLAGRLAATVVTPPPAGPAVKLVAWALAGTPAPAELRVEPESFPPVEDLSPQRLA
jgi:ABC-type sugar transport system substrate-binding protein